MTWNFTCTCLYYTHINRMRKGFKILCFDRLRGLNDKVVGGGVHNSDKCKGLADRCAFPKMEVFKNHIARTNCTGKPQICRYVLYITFLFVVVEQYVLKIGEAPVTQCISGFTAFDLPPPRGPLWYASLLFVLHSLFSSMVNWCHNNQLLQITSITTPSIPDYVTLFCFQYALFQIVEYLT